VKEKHGMLWNGMDSHGKGNTSKAKVRQVKERKGK
jgi:hypothetical protein